MIGSDEENTIVHRLDSITVSLMK